MNMTTMSIKICTIGEVSGFEIYFCDPKVL